MARTTSSCSSTSAPRREFDFEPRDHIELGQMLGAIDLERGAKVSGSRFYFLTGIGAQLELALVNMAMDQARDAGFTQVIAAVAGQAARDGGHRLPRPGRRRRLPDRGRGPLPRRHQRGRRWRPTTPTRSSTPRALPLRYAAFSPCFRKEAGSHGKDTKGIIRVHWFDKVEMFVYTTVEESYAEHQRLLAWEKEFLDKLELCLPRHRRRRRRPGLSAPAQVRLRGLDPDARASYRELTSTSNCTDFQSRRLDIRGRFRADGAGRRITPVATLNGTLTAITRTIVAHPGDPPARGRLGHRAAGAAALPRRPRGPEAAQVEPVTRRDRRAGGRRLVALDIDGTLLKWVEGTGEDYETITARSTTRSTAPSTPARTSCSPAAARRTA